MTVGQLIAELQKLCPEHEHDPVSCESRKYSGELDMEGVPMYCPLDQVRVSSNGRRDNISFFSVVLC